MMKQLPLLLLLFSLLTGNSSACTNADSKVISTEGTDVILPCSPSTRKNLQNKLFDWKKLGQGGATHHEVFMWDSAVHYDDHSGQSEQFKGRVSHFQNELQHGNASIVIRETKVTDSGRYSCGFPKLQPREEFCIELVVSASPEPSVTILEETKDWSLLQCLVRGSHPEPKVEWRNSSGNILPADEPQVSERGGSYDVILQTTVTKTDNYSCVATQEEIKHQTRPAHIYVLLNDSGSPIGWISAVVVLCIIVVVAGVVVYKGYIKLNHLNKKIEKHEKTEERNTPPDSAVYPMIPAHTVP